MKYMAFAAFVAIMTTSHNPEPKNIFDFKHPFCSKLLTQTQVYLDSATVGSIICVNVNPSNNICFGKVEFKESFKVYSTMSFYYHVSLLGNSKVYIKNGAIDFSRELKPGQDTIVIYTAVPE